MIGPRAQRKIADRDGSRNAGIAPRERRPQELRPSRLFRLPGPDDHLRRGRGPRRAAPRGVPRAGREARVESRAPRPEFLRLGDGLPRDPLARGGGGADPPRFPGRGRPPHPEPLRVGTAPDDRGVPGAARSREDAGGEGGPLDEGLHPPVREARGDGDAPQEGRRGRPLPSGPPSRGDLLGPPGPRGPRLHRLHVGDDGLFQGGHAPAPEPLPERPFRPEAHAARGGGRPRVVPPARPRLRLRVRVPLPGLGRLPDRLPRQDPLPAGHPQGVRRREAAPRPHGPARPREDLRQARPSLPREARREAPVEGAGPAAEDRRASEEEADRRLRRAGPRGRRRRGGPEPRRWRSSSSGSASRSRSATA